MAPPLRSLAPYWSAERLSTYILNPEWFRSKNPDFDEQRALLGRWLMTR